MTSAALVAGVTGGAPSTGGAAPSPTTGPFTNATINPGSGKDTVTQAGFATVKGGSVAPTVLSTLTTIGGSSVGSFVGGNGQDGGTPKPPTAGLGTQSATGASSSAHLFSFSASVAGGGGHFKLQNLVGAGTVNVAGYTPNHGLLATTSTGGHTVTTLDEGQVKATLAGFHLPGTGG